LEFIKVGGERIEYAKSNGFGISRKLKRLIYCGRTCSVIVYEDGDQFVINLPFPTDICFFKVDTNIQSLQARAKSSVRDYSTEFHLKEAVQ
jgi:hypothetical protein